MTVSLVNDLSIPVAKTQDTLLYATLNRTLIPQPWLDAIKAQPRRELRLDSQGLDFVLARTRPVYERQKLDYAWAFELLPVSATLEILAARVPLVLSLPASEIHDALRYDSELTVKAALASKVAVLCESFGRMHRSSYFESSKDPGPGQQLKGELCVVRALDEALTAMLAFPSPLDERKKQRRALHFADALCWLLQVSGSKLAVTSAWNSIFEALRKA